ncbi:hypothetical protein ACFSTE_14625 [Aquimarina hainanensis]|uniref:Uncharacterized protein n=1 Tax=Aquimarina hainanensis TaxID=1578017 RepID=A0ABW5NAD3_9FLAO
MITSEVNIDTYNVQFVINQFDRFKTGENKLFIASYVSKFLSLTQYQFLFVLSELISLYDLKDNILFEKLLFIINLMDQEDLLIPKEELLDKVYHLLIDYGFDNLFSEDLSSADDLFKYNLNNGIQLLPSDYLKYTEPFYFNGVLDYFTSNSLSLINSDLQGHSKITKEIYHKYEEILNDLEIKFSSKYPSIEKSSPADFSEYNLPNLIIEIFKNEIISFDKYGVQKSYRYSNVYYLYEPLKEFLEGNSAIGIDIQEDFSKTLTLNDNYGQSFLASQLIQLYKGLYKREIRYFVSKTFIANKQQQRLRKVVNAEKFSELPRNYKDLIEFFWVLVQQKIINNSFSEVSEYLFYYFPELGTKSTIEKTPTASKSNFQSNYKKFPNLRVLMNRI